ncbi:endonuclease [Chryseobacterium sp.]|uniref:endonuclease n=1 Tax=Chryseobacterium sp. TaxID=1871047 RepID=UPI0011C7AF1E|nr:endonuclease [Chryseobacterium sp.]TXF79407.1 T9SS type A sorting domain-containing protein [Chryseobacterium sp.]
MKKILFLGFLIPFFAFSQIPVGYYDAAVGLTGYALKSKVHDIISSKTISWHYGDLPNYYAQTDLDKYYDHTATNTTFLLDMYSEIPTGPDAYEYTSAQLVSSAGAEGVGYNREHMVPQSTFSTGSISGYPMYSDLFHVVPADARINQLRSNYPYGVVGSTIYYTFTNGSRIGNCAIPGSPYTGRVYEPINEFKGDIARTLLYFAVRYEGKLGSFNHNMGTTPANDESLFDGTEERALDPSYITLLKQWNAMDPVSPKEIDKNNIVYGIQKNRNPFIDHPEWVNMIWSETPDAIAPGAPGALTVTQQNAHFVNLTWSPSPDPDVLGYRIYVNGSTTPAETSKSTSVTIDHLLPSTAYTFTVKAFDKGYLESPVSNVAAATTLASDSFSSDLMIIKYLEGSSDNKALELINRTGHSVNLNNYRINIQFFSGSSYYFSDTYELEGTVADGENFVILNPNANFTCFTNAQAKFVTASTPMTYTGTQYIELAYDGNIPVDVIGAKNTTNTVGNVSLYRLASITQPTATFSLSEWQSNPSDYCQNLGILKVSENTVGDDVLIYPNPVENQLFVDAVRLKDVKSIQIYDFNGKLIKTEMQPFKNKKSIDVHELNTGLYLLRLNGSSYKFIKK